MRAVEPSPDERRVRRVEQGVYLLAAVSLIVLGVVFQTVFLNWIVGPAWMVTVVTVGTPVALGGARAGELLHPAAHEVAGVLPGHPARLPAARSLHEAAGLRNHHRRLHAEGVRPGPVPPRVARRRLHPFTVVRRAFRQRGPVENAQPGMVRGPRARSVGAWY